MTLAGSVAMKIMDTQDSMIVVGLLAALACGLAVGIFNYGLILVLRIPPIIATLSSSFLILSTAIAYGRGLRIKPPPLLADFTTAQIAGVPVLAICVVAARRRHGRRPAPHDLRPLGRSPSARASAPPASPASASSASASAPTC